MTRIPTNGIELNVEVTGEGAPLLLLHGFTGDTSSWEPFVNAWDGHRLIMVDIVGHGRSDSPADPERYSMAHAVTDLCAVLDALAVDRAAVLGYSMGGRVALHFALDAPTRVSALILESASAGIASASEREKRVESDNALADDIERDGIKAFADRWQALSLFDSQGRLPAYVLAAQRERRISQSPLGQANSLRGMGTGRQSYLQPRLGELSMPTLLLAGALDTRYATLAHEMGALIADSRVEIIPDAGHAAHLEKPDIFREAAGRFLVEPSSTHFVSHDASGFNPR